MSTTTIVMTIIILCVLAGGAYGVKVYLDDKKKQEELDAEAAGLEAALAADAAADAAASRRHRMLKKQHALKLKKEKIKAAKIHKRVLKALAPSKTHTRSMNQGYNNKCGVMGL